VVSPDRVLLIGSSPSFLGKLIFVGVVAGHWACGSCGFL
jgi:ABC-type Fe3+-siderophore transport system permease subunit